MCVRGGWVDVGGGGFGEMGGGGGNLMYIPFIYEMHTH